MLIISYICLHRSYRLVNSADYHKMLSKFKAQEIANLVWAFATLNSRDSKIMEHVSPYIKYICSDERTGNYDERSISRSFKRQEVANIAWSCTVLEQYPKELMPLLYTALFGGVDANSESLKSIYGDDGIQRQAVMTMFYVQMALDMEAPELKLNLPRDFPLGWRESHSTNSNNNMHSINDRTNSSLQLTTSRLQSVVSHALGRLGFDHVEEHVISTDELESNHDIVLSCENQEFLSIDIADVDNLIGLEVDGPGHFITVLDDSDDSDDTTEVKRKRGNVRVSKTSDGKGFLFTANSKQQINGPTTLKDRLLQHLGWSVIHIPYWEWRDLKGDGDAEENYIQNLLQDIK